MFTCTKRYTEIPFAHRQWRHDGHCSKIHGHSWCFEFTFGAPLRDENGFVVDFGKLGEIKKYLERFDHALVLCETDPKLPDLARLDMARILVVDDASSEGLARHLFTDMNRIIMSITRDRVKLLSVVVYEDSRNSARFAPD